MKNFEEILSRKISKNLAIELYKIFKPLRDFSFKDQIQRAGISISNNIAEGFEKQSNREFQRFLYIAKGSCGEVRSMLHIAKELEYIDVTTFSRLYKTTIRISKLIQGLIRSLK